MTTTVQAEKREKGAVEAVVALALLEAVRTHDHPGEVLEDEDLTVSLPRRLGLKSVVLSQIERYEKAHLAGRKVPVSDVSNLFRLVLRRPDAEAILRDAGKTVAGFHYERLSRVSALLLRLMPGSFALGPARRAARSMLRGIAGNGRPRVEGKPFTIRVPSSIGAALDPIACVLYTGALEQLIRLYTGRSHALRHEHCLARGDDACEWVLNND